MLILEVTSIVFIILSLTFLIANHFAEINYLKIQIKNKDNEILILREFNKRNL